jgi:pilus assembly protein Flp/PilA
LLNRNSFSFTRSATPAGCSQNGKPDMKFYTKVQALINSMRTEEEGATAVEYGLMVSLIAVVIIGAVALIGTNLSTMFNGVAGSL